MEILMLYHRLPFPPNKGDKIRAYQQVSYLSRKHKVWLACFIDTEEDFQHSAEIERLCHRFQAVPLDKRIALSRGGLNVIMGKTITEGYYGSRAMWRVIQEWSGDHFFDVAFAFSSSMAIYLEDLPVARRVVDMNDFDSYKWSEYAQKTVWPMSGIFRTESKRLAARELELIRKVDLTLMVNDRECERLTDSQLQSKLASFRTPMHLESYESVWGVHRDKIIGYVATLDYPPNIDSAMWFSREVWPQVRKRHPDAQWWIVGRKPHRSIEKLAKKPGIIVTGAVDDIRRYYARMRTFIAPAQTDIGVQTKVLEAMAAGRPIVITQKGHDGIRATAGREYLVATEPMEFAQAVCDLLDDHPRCEALGRQAVEFIRRNYDTPVLMPQFEQLLLGRQAVQKAAS